MRIIFNFKLFNKEFDFSARIQPLRDIPVYGYTNLCKEGKYIPFFDFDGWELQWVEWSIKYLQDTYRLSSAYIFQSSVNGYHAAIFDKLHIAKLIEILKASGTDHNFIFCPINFGKKLWVLRLTEKEGQRPKYIKTIKSDNCFYEKSLPHVTLLENLYPNMEIDKSHCDNEQTLISASYKIQ